MQYTLKDIYKDYQEKYNTIDKDTYTNIVQEFNIMIIDKKELLEEGQLLYSPKTGKGVKWHIYHTDEFYCKYYWRKGKCKIPNKSVYRFDATRGLKGNKEKLINLLKTDDLAYLKFKKH